MAATDTAATAQIPIQPDPREIARLSAEHARAWNEGRHDDVIAITARLNALRGIAHPRPRRRAFATGFTTW